MPDDTSEHEALEGVIERITYQAPDSGWTVARLAVDGRREPVPVVGNMLGPEVGESVRLFGKWEKHDRYGPQFRFERYQLVRPATAAAVRAYLGGGLVDGIGPKLAEVVVGYFGDETLEVLENEPQRVTEVPGIGEKRARALREAWERHRSVHRIMVFLHDHGVGGALAGRIYAAYGDQAIETLERRPYRLARDIRGIGFLTADRIARSVGIAPDDPSRIEAGVVHVIRVATDEGHLYLPRPLAVPQAEQLLAVPAQNVEMAVERLVEAKELVQEQHEGEVALYVPHLHEVEMEVACRLRYFAENRPPGTPTQEHMRGWLAHWEQMARVELTDEQRGAVTAALQRGACVITGGPGTGKTTVTRAIVDACQALGRPVALASPTGRAAKRLQQLAGHDASTIHRLLAYDPHRGGFRYGVEEPLRVALVIIDEASMLDVVLARDVLRAIPAQGRIVFIGDADQLPSVGPGNLLRDIVASGQVAVHRLTHIFRQGEGSDIITSAHLLNRGEAPRFPRREQWLQRRGDCVLLEEEDVEAAAARVIRTATESLPRLGFRPEDIQVIAPLHRGPIGVAALNAGLQAAFNPPAPGKREARRGEVVFREGDRVLQTVNDYDKGVYNGDIGYLRRINPEDRIVTVEFDLGDVEYQFGELEQIEPAYALTVHKSQGSEYPAVVIVMHSSHYIMLQRNLLYTALTRAQRMACIVGNQRGIWRAISNVSERERFTRLAARLRDELPCGDFAPSTALG